jgi:predicted RNA-binding protein with PIN domain
LGFKLNGVISQKSRDGKISHPFDMEATRMPYLIDGHNLIPKLGLRLDSLDDEMELVRHLQEFCRLRRVQVEVYFDGSPPGQASTRKAGMVTAHFVRKGASADAAIENRLLKMKKGAKSWTVVSSDRRVQRAAGAAQAGIMSADEFAQEMRTAQSEGMSKSKSETELSPGEVDEWLETFKKRGDKI